MDKIILNLEFINSHKDQFAKGELEHFERKIQVFEEYLSFTAHCLKQKLSSGK